MGDITGDGRLEVLVSGKTPEVYALDLNASVLPDWPAVVQWPYDHPVNPYQNRIQAVADVDGDHMPEVVIGALVGPVIFNHDATPLLAAAPLQVESDETGAQHDLGLSLADIDGDGDVELLAGIWGVLHAYDFSGGVCAVQWARSGSDLGNTCAYPPPSLSLGDYAVFYSICRMPHNR